MWSRKSLDMQRTDNRDVFVTKELTRYSTPRQPWCVVTKEITRYLKPRQPCRSWSGIRCMFQTMYVPPCLCSIVSMFHPRQKVSIIHRVFTPPRLCPTVSLLNHVYVPTCLYSTMSMFYHWQEGSMFHRVFSLPWLCFTVSMLHSAFSTPCLCSTTDRRVYVPLCLYSIVSMFHRVFTPPCLRSTLSVFMLRRREVWQCVVGEIGWSWLRQG